MTDKNVARKPLASAGGKRIRYDNRRTNREPTDHRVSPRGKTPPWVAIGRHLTVRVREHVVELSAKREDRAGLLEPLAKRALRRCSS